jgi:hypothetical protein
VPASASQNVRFEIPLINASNYVSESRNLLKTSTNSTFLVTIVFVQDISYLYATRAPRHPRQFLNSLSVQKYSIDLCFCCMHFHPSPDLRPYSKNFPDSAVPPPPSHTRRNSFRLFSNTLDPRGTAVDLFQSNFK